MLSKAQITGVATPVRAGQKVTLQRSIRGKWRTLLATTTRVERSCATCARTATFRFTPLSRDAVSWTVRVALYPYNAPKKPVVSSPWKFFHQAVLNREVLPVEASLVSHVTRSGCPVGRSNLRRLILTHVRPDGQFARGELILHKNVVDDMTRVFAKALDRRFPISRIRNANDYRGSDRRSMEADNTSAYNCRKVVGNPYRLSRHSWGDAIDINPVRTPYQDITGRWWPANAGTYRNRADRRPGMHYTSTVIPAAMRAEDWLWGARWAHPDYHHFSLTGQ